MSKSTLSAVQKSLQMPDNESVTLNKYKHIPKKSKSGLVFNLNRKNITSTGTWNRSEFRNYHSISGIIGLGNTITFELEESFTLLNLYLQINLSQISQTGGTAANLAYNKLPLLIDTLTVWSNNGTNQLKVWTGEMIYYLIQLTHSEESLETITAFSGMGSKTQRSDDNANDTLEYYLPLRCVLFNSDIPLYHLKGKLRFQVKFKPVEDCYVYDGTSPVGAGLTSTMLWAEFQDFNRSLKASLVANKNIKHYRVLAPEAAELAIPSGTEHYADRYLNFIGPCAFLLFYVTKPSPTGDDVVDNNTKIKSFVLKDSQGNIISYAQDITHGFNRTVMAYKYFDQYVKNAPFLDLPNLYFYPFSERPPVAMVSGSDFGYRQLTGNERISVKFDAPTGEDLTLHIFAYSYQLLQINPASGSLTMLT